MVPSLTQGASGRFSPTLSTLLICAIVTPCKSTAFLVLVSFPKLALLFCTHRIDLAGFEVDIVLNDVYYNPNGYLNLVSVNDLNTAGYNVRYDVDDPHLVNISGDIVISIPKSHQGLFTVRRFFSAPGTAPINGYSIPAMPATVSQKLTRPEIFHMRFHASSKKIGHLPKLYPDLIKGMSRADLNRLCSCRHCNDANIVRSAYPRASSTRYKSDADLWSMDMYDIGEEHVSVTQKRYVFLFIMMHSRFCIAISTSTKSEALSAFKQAISYAGFAPKRLRSDNAKEFESAEFTDFCASHPVPIFREWSNPYQQHQNGVVEHMVHILTQKTRVFLLQSGLGPSFWSFALSMPSMCTTIFLIARYREMWPPSYGLSVDPFFSTYVLLVVIVPS